MGIYNQWQINLLQFEFIPLDGKKGNKQNEKCRILSQKLFHYSLVHLTKSNLMHIPVKKQVSWGLNLFLLMQTVMFSFSCFNSCKDSLFQCYYACEELFLSFLVELFPAATFPPYSFFFFSLDVSHYYLLGWNCLDIFYELYYSNTLWDVMFFLFWWIGSPLISIDLGTYLTKNILLH